MARQKKAIDVRPDAEALADHARHLQARLDALGAELRQALLAGHDTARLREEIAELGAELAEAQAALDGHREAEQARAAAEREARIARRASEVAAEAAGHLHDQLADLAPPPFPVLNRTSR